MSDKDIKEFHDLDKLKNMKKANKFNYIQGKQITDEESGHRIYDIVGSRLPSVKWGLHLSKNTMVVRLCYIILGYMLAVLTWYVIITV